MITIRGYQLYCTKFQRYHVQAKPWVMDTKIVDVARLHILWQFFSFQLCTSLLGVVKSVQIAVL
jgi:hypothetical protein